MVCLFALCVCVFCSSSDWLDSLSHAKYQVLCEENIRAFNVLLLHMNMWDRLLIVISFLFIAVEFVVVCVCLLLLIAARDGHEQFP